MARAPIPKPTGPRPQIPGPHRFEPCTLDNLPEILGPRGAAQSQRSAAREQMEVKREEIHFFQDINFDVRRDKWT